jgi:hypothetical protein
LSFRENQEPIPITTSALPINNRKIPATTDDETTIFRAEGIEYG